MRSQTAKQTKERGILMRKILFRGKRLLPSRMSDEEWLYGYFYVDPETGNHLIYLLESEGIYKSLRVVPETVGQFTGLTDKNGKGIFEGDIVKWDDESNGKYWRVAVVEFNPDIQFRIIQHHDHALSTPEGYVFRFGNFAYRNTEKYLEVIGTIHDGESK